MERAITWYEVLGVLPGAEPDKIRRKYDERTALLRAEMIAGAPSNVLAAVGRAQNFLDTAWEILGSTASRNRYDEAAGFRRKGLAPSGSFATSSWHESADLGVAGDLGGDSLAGLLELGGFLGGAPRRPSKVPVPDIRGLFYDVCMEVVGRLGLRVRSVQLTPHPMPVDGLVIDQVPPAPGKLRRGETVTAHVWHPPIRNHRLERFTHGRANVKALVFRHSLAREAASAIGGRVDRRVFVSRLAPVRLEDVDEQPLPAADWVRVRTTFSGLCGSDVKQILLNGSRDNPLTALVSFPHVLGHEVVGRKTDSNERVVLNPWLSCLPRGVKPPCDACRAGRYPWCRSFRSGDLPAGIHIGNCAAAAGAHAERFAAHPSQLFGIPDGVSDDAAVLADPVSVSLRSILLAPPPGGRPVLVYGSGTLAFAAIALLRHLYPETEVWAAVRSGSRASLAARLGAHAVLPSAPDDLVGQVAHRMGTAPLVPWSQRDWLQDGPAVVYDTIGSTETVETSLRLLATGGTLVVSGVEPPRRFEWTPLYFKELHVIGSNGFGVEEVGGVAKHAMLHYFDFVAAGLDLTPVITHRFPLDRWDEAVLTLKDARRTGAVKVLLEP